jgi:hypothetical protein
MLVKYSGLKCDCCDYRDDEVRFEDYEKYIDYPCPKCREPLLTKEDYQKCLRLINTVKFANEIDRVLRWINPFHYYRLIFGDKRKMYAIDIYEVRK